MNTNPLTQYFRRPSIHIKLPSMGKYYDDQVIDMPITEEIPVYPMTAIDEITSKTPDALYNGSAVVDIIKSCIPSIKDPWKINNIDLDAILIAIRIASTGEEMDITSVCPSCNTDGKYGVNLIEVLSKKTNIDYDINLKIRDLEFSFKPLTYFETNSANLAQYEIQKMLVMLENIDNVDLKIEKTKESINKLFDITTDTITNTIEYIKTPESTVSEKKHIKEFLIKCDKKTNALIKDFSIQLKNQNEMKPLRIKCINCGHEYQQSLVLNVTDFFD